MIKHIKNRSFVYLVTHSIGNYETSPKRIVRAFIREKKAELFIKSCKLEGLRIMQKYQYRSWCWVSQTDPNKKDPLFKFDDTGFSYEIQIIELTK